MQSTFRELDGQRFHLRTSGPEDAPKLLLLHGFPEYSGAWEELAAELPGYRCLAPDQRGYGQSPCPSDSSAYEMRHLAADMAALIRAEGAPMAVIGHDWGSAVAYALAIRMPELVSHLVILNGVHPACFQTALARGGAQAQASQYFHFLRRPDSHERLAADGFTRLRRLFAEGMDMSWLSGDRLDAYTAEWARPGRLKAMTDWYRASPVKVPEPGESFTPPDFDPASLSVPMPHLVIWGDGDTALLIENLDDLDRYAPDLTVEHLSDADHWLHHQQPAEVAARLRDWLTTRGLPPRQTG